MEALVWQSSVLRLPLDLVFDKIPLTQCSADLFIAYAYFSFDHFFRMEKFQNTTPRFSFDLKPAKYIRQVHIILYFGSVWFCPQSHWRPSSVVRPSSFNSGFSEKRCIAPVQILWRGPYPPHLKTIFTFCFQNKCPFSNFYDFPPFHSLRFSLFPLTRDPMGPYTPPPPAVFIRSEPNYMINKVVMREYKVIINILAIFQKIQNFVAL